VRNRYLVCYDVADPKRLTRVHKTMLGFGDWLQLSVFACDLTEQRRVELLIALTALINVREDRVMIIDLGPTEARALGAIEYIGTGPRLRKPARSVVI
jgi:CRISPR-associated protein Cas2